MQSLTPPRSAMRAVGMAYSFGVADVFARLLLSSPRDERTLRLPLTEGVAAEAMGSSWGSDGPGVVFSSGVTGVGGGRLLMFKRLFL